MAASAAGAGLRLELYGPDAAYISGSYGDTGAAESITHNAIATGTYWVRVYGYPIGNGSFSATEAYTLSSNFTGGAINIVAPPQDQSVPWGASARFSVTATTATGSALSYEWLLNGSSIPGATSATYLTPPTSLSDNGDTYSVRVIGDFGSAISEEAILTVTNPLVNTWTGNVSNDWNDPLNWDLGHVPNGTEVVEIVGGSVTASSLYGPLVRILGGAATLSGGINGNVTVAGGGTLVVEGGQHDLTDATLTNQGTVIWKTGLIRGYGASVIVNEAGGVFEVRADNWIDRWNGSLSFSNAGTVRRTTGTGDAYIHVPFANTGAVEVLSGRLLFYGDLDGMGIISIASGAQLVDQYGTVTVGGANFSEFQRQWFTPAELVNPLISSAFADPEGDGIANLLEYAFASDPREPSSVAGQTSLDVSNDHLALTYIRRRDQPALVYTVEVSADLSAWTSGATETEQILVTPLDEKREQVTVRDLSALNAGSTRFMRLKVSQP